MHQSLKMDFRSWIMVLLVLLSAASSIPVSRGEHAGALGYLRKYGYLHVPLDRNSPEYKTKEILDALRTFQKANGLPVSGRLDFATEATMKKPRCGEEDDFGRKSLKYRVIGYWRKVSLTYRIYNYTPHLGAVKTRSAIRKAFGYWSQVSPLRFTEVQGGKADIKISFHRRDNTCPVPFDGRGRVLAHADPPETGMVHFDADEWWTEEKRYGSNLRIVATHEVGHALGLGHSQHYRAAMAPVYRGYRSNFQLHADDIQGIQALYGKPVRTFQTRKKKSNLLLPRERAPDPCRVALDAVMMGRRRRTYVFSGQLVWTASSSGWDPPVQISALWKWLPGSLDAAVHSPQTGKSYFLKEDKMWRYTGFSLDPGFPRPLANVPANVNSALYFRQNQTLIFVKGSEFWEWDETGATAPGVRPGPLADLFPGAPGRSDAAVTWADGHVYMFGGRRCWRLSRRERAEEGACPPDLDQLQLRCKQRTTRGH